MIKLGIMFEENGVKNLVDLEIGEIILFEFEPDDLREYLKQLPDENYLLSII